MSNDTSTGLPFGWSETPIGEIVCGKVRQAPPEDEALVTYVDIGCVDRQSKRIHSPQMIIGAIAPTRARQWVQAGDVLVSMTRPNLNAVAIVTEDLDGAIASTGFDVLRSVEVDPKWIYYRVQSQAFISDICEDLQGVVYPAVRPTDIRRHQIPIPPLPEQHRIVAAIESHLSRLDAATTALTRVQRNLARYRASVLHAAVTGRLVPTEAELARAEGREYEPASVLLTRILGERRQRWEAAELAKMTAAGKAPKDERWKARYVEPVAPETEGLGELPEGWCWTGISEWLAADNNSMTTGPFGSLLKKHEHVVEGIPVLGIENVEPMQFVPGAKIHVTRAKAKQIARYDARPGDLLITRSGTVGRVCVVPETVTEARFSTNIMRVRFLVSSPLAAWFVLVLSGSSIVQDQIGDLSKGTTRNFLNQSILSQLAFPVPPLAEQTRILAEVDRQISGIDALQSTLTGNANRLTRLRQSILRLAFEGRLVDQDPDDEPAAVLLERIRAERSTAPDARRGRTRRPDIATQEPLL